MCRNVSACYTHHLKKVCWPKVSRLVHAFIVSKAWRVPNILPVHNGHLVHLNTSTGYEHPHGYNFTGWKLNATALIFDSLCIFPEMAFCLFSSPQPIMTTDNRSLLKPFPLLTLLLLGKDKLLKVHRMQQLACLTVLLYSSCSLGH